MTHRLLLSLSTLAASLFILTAPAPAQCFGPDGFGATVCNSPTAPTLPSFPAISMGAQGICWDACSLSGQTCALLSLGAPLSNGCSQFTAPLNVLDCAGTPLLKGLMTLDYTRTWEELPVPGAAPIQVWRFAVKVDLAASSSSIPGCAVPLCSTLPGSTAFYYGYVDYSLNCATGTWESAIVLYHAADDSIHNTAFSAVPGTFHPSLSFAIVGPDTTTNPFVPGNLLPPTGSLLEEATRRMTPNAVGMCYGEEPIQQGVFLPLVSGCLNPLSLAPPMQSGNLFNASGLCGGGFQSLNLWPLTPWYELTTTSIGRWMNASSYPGPEHASVAEGLLVYSDPCLDPTVPPQQSFDIVYGSLTVGGYFIPSTPLAILTDRLFDLASNYSTPVGGPIPMPLFGRVDVTDHAIYGSIQ